MPQDNASAYDAERQLRAQLEAINQATLAIAGEFDLLGVLQIVVDQARLVAGAEYAALGIGTNPDQPFDPWVFSGVPPELAQVIGRFPRPIGTLGAAAREGQVLRLRDLRRDPRFRGFPPHHPPMVSFLGVPIRYRGASVGTLYLSNKVGAEEFSEDDQRAIELLVQHVALAIEHARVHEVESFAGAAAAVAREMELGRMVDTVLHETQRTLGAVATALFWADAERRVLRLFAHHNLPPAWAERARELPYDAPDLTARAAATGQLVVVEDLAALPPEMSLTRAVTLGAGLRWLVAAPLLARAGLIGVLTCAGGAPKRFGRREREAVAAVANTFAMGLENARLYDETEKERRVLGVVNQAALSLITEVELPVLLQRLAETARQLTSSRYAAIAVLDEPGEFLARFAFAGVPEKVARRVCPLPAARGLLGDVLREGRPLRLWDRRQDERVLGLPPFHPPITHSFLGLPIVSKGRQLGVLYVADREGAEAFSDEDEQLLALLMPHAAAAIENAELYQRLGTERSWLRTVIERSPVGVLLVQTTGGERVLANRQAEALFGQSLPPEGGIAQFVGRLCRPDGTVLKREELAASRALRGQVITAEEQLLRLSNGRTVPVLVSAGPIRDAADRLLGAVVVFEDITPFKELERLREEWTSIIAHDLRQPVTTITGYAGMVRRLLERQAAPEQVNQGLEHIRTAAQNLSRMIGDLLDVSRIEARRLPLQRQAVDLPALVQAVVERSADVTRGHPVRVQVRGKIPPVQADPGRLEQVLDNLLSNAAKYGYPETDILVEVESRDGAVEVAVSNRGKGIPSEDLPKLFTRFHSTAAAREERTAGLGLGLYIARGLLEAHGGRIWAESTPGQTTTFRFILPLAA